MSDNSQDKLAWQDFPDLPSQITEEYKYIRKPSSQNLLQIPLCMTPGHVIAESELENQRRKGCVVWVDCPHCVLKINCCCHSGGGLRPKCIKYCAGFANMGAFGQSGLHA
jgi:hypothetical protein